MMPYVEVANNKKPSSVATLPSPITPPTRRIEATTTTEELYNYCEVLNCDFNSKLFHTKHLQIHDVL